MKTNRNSVGATPSLVDAWGPDVLGDDFTSAELTTTDGARVTLISYRPDGGVPDGARQIDGVPDGARFAAELRDGERSGVGASDAVGGSATDAGHAARPAVLYVHGFSDYFFQAHVAQALSAAGYAFYAVDLRGYGRSMSSHMDAGGDPNMVAELALHARDLDAAVDAVRAEGHGRIVLMAHSMGGLVAALWAATRPSRAAALVLNSPWFDLNESNFLRGPGTAAIKALAEFAPTTIVGGLKPHYGKALHKGTGGQWECNLDWKPLSGFPVQAGWLASVRRAQQRLNRGLGIEIPVLVLASTRTGSAKMWHPRLTATDSVLDVEHIAKGAAALGPDVTFVQIAGGAHDLALSHSPAAREDYLAAVIGWLDHLFGQ